MTAPFTKADLPIPLESAEQVALFDWAGANRVPHPDLQWLYAIPNGGKRSKVTAARLKREGVKRGYPDIGLDVARGGYLGLRIEMKRRKKSHTSEDQLTWHRRLWAQGYRVVVVKGWEIAAAELLAYLALPATRVVRDVARSA